MGFIRLKNRAKDTFVPNNKRPRCRYCKKAMSEWTDIQRERTVDSDGNNVMTEHISGRGLFGYDGTGVFCTLRCGYYYALKIVKAAEGSGK